VPSSLSFWYSDNCTLEIPPEALQVGDSITLDLAVTADGLDATAAVRDDLFVIVVRHARLTKRFFVCGYVAVHHRSLSTYRAT